MISSGLRGNELTAGHERDVIPATDIPDLGLTIRETQRNDAVRRYGQNYRRSQKSWYQVDQSLHILQEHKGHSLLLLIAIKSSLWP
jgi:hypothetical protein